MTDYYAILGLTKNATDVEIKASFRRLAKIYHPDKGLDNPDAKVIFERILKAYNVLINPNSRRRYDNTHYATGTEYTGKTKPRDKSQKEWTFTDEDLKRRQYYQNYYKAKQKTATKTAEAKRYSDYKYILFATPLAVALLMLIISMFTNVPETKKNIIENKVLEIKTGKIKQLTNGDTPYSGYFKGIRTFDTDNSLKINNSSGYDAVVAIFDLKTNNYLQHAYLQDSYFIEFSKLPDTGVYWKCMLGTNWNENKLLFDDKVSGAFDSIVQFQNWKLQPAKFNGESVEQMEFLDVLEPQSKNKRYISNDKDFFEH